MEAFVWLRGPGDVVISIDVFFLALFAARSPMGGKRVQTTPFIVGAAQPSKP